jgi:hypothetical protein
MRGKIEDWSGVEQVFRTAGPPPNNEPGAAIAGGAICRDDKRLYVRIDSANGRPMEGGIQRSIGISLKQDSSHELHLTFDVWSDGTNHTSIYDSVKRQSTQGGSYAIGPSFIELSFPLSWFPKGFDLTTPVDASLFAWFQGLKAGDGTGHVLVLIDR